MEGPLVPKRSLVSKLLVYEDKSETSELPSEDVLHPCHSLIGVTSVLSTPSVSLRNVFTVHTLGFV